MKTRYKHIHFTEQPGCDVWYCYTNNNQLGVIGLGAWHRMTFCPDMNTEYSADCLDDISHFIGQLEAERNKPCKP